MTLISGIPEPQIHGARAKLAVKRKKIKQEQKNTQHNRKQSKYRGARQEDKIMEKHVMTENLIVLKNNR